MNIAELQRKFPWRKSLDALIAPENMYVTIDGECDPETLWLLLSDTSRFNRALGLSRREENEQAGQLVSVEKILGWKQISIEIPWDWVKGQYFVIHRKYKQGFALAAKVIVYIERLQNIECAQKQQIRIHMEYSFLPSNFIFRFILKIGLKRLKPLVSQLLIKLIEQAKDFKQEDNLYPQVYTRKTKCVWTSALKERLFEYRKLFIKRNTPLELVQKIFNLLECEDEFELSRIKPVILAKQWGHSLDQILDGLIFGTKIGMFQMKWAAVCPHCRGPRQEFSHLIEIRARYICEACSTSFTTANENSIEVYFAPDDSLIKINKIFYCVAEPAKKGHILIQHEIGGGSTADFAIRIKENLAYRVRILGKVRDEMALKFDNAKYPEIVFNGTCLESRSFCPLDHTVRFTNKLSSPIVFILEEMWWGRSIMPPSYVLLHPTFKEIFCEEVMSGEVQMNLGGKTVVAISGKRNDHPSDLASFFDSIKKDILKKNGRVIRSTESAVFILFEDPFEGSEFLNYLFDLELFCQKMPELKVAVDHGACYSANLNNSLEFYGNPFKNAIKLCLLSDDSCMLLTEDYFELIRGKAGHISNRIEPIRLRLEGEQEKLVYAINF